MELFGGMGGGGESTPSVECAHCGTTDEFGDDFCHECGHSFGWAGRSTGDGDDEHEGGGEPCPTCHSGTIEELSYGVRQCDTCGYTARDWSTA
jgi:hypothetical protein